MTKDFKTKAKEAKKIIDDSKSILLHCHPFADPDSVGSVLSMISVLESQGKKVTAISGDSEYPENLMELPNHEKIVNKNYHEIDTALYDLFIILDSSSMTQVSLEGDIVFPKSMKTIVIDHHITNTGFGDLNIIEPYCSSTCEIVYQLLKELEIKIDTKIALCLFVGIFADTGGFKYPNCSPDTLKIASELAHINPDYHKIIFDLENMVDTKEIEFIKLALSSLEKYFSDQVVISAVSYEKLKSENISKEFAHAGVPNILRSVIGWNIAILMVENEPGIISVSLRTRNPEKYDVSKIVKVVGKNGGGHKAAAGTTIFKPLEKAKKETLEAIKNIYASELS